MKGCIMSTTKNLGKVLNRRNEGKMKSLNERVRHQEVLVKEMERVGIFKPQEYRIPLSKRHKTLSASVKKLA